MEFLGTVFDVAKFGVERRKFGAKAEDGEVHGGATALAAMILGGRDHSPRESLALMGRSHGEHSEVAPGFADFDVDRRDEFAGVVKTQQEIALRHHVCELMLVRPSAFEESFDGKGGVDDWQHRGNVGGRGEADEGEWRCHK